MEENLEFQVCLLEIYWGHMKENEHTVTAQRLMFTLFFYNFVTNFYRFSTTYCSNFSLSVCVKHIAISSEHTALQIALHFSLKYFDGKVYVLGVELKHECSFCFFWHWYSIIFNEQQMHLATLWSAWIFQCIDSINIVQFVVRMGSYKNRIMRHSRKTFCGL